MGFGGWGLLVFGLWLAFTFHSLLLVFQRDIIAFFYNHPIVRFIRIAYYHWIRRPHLWDFCDDNY